MKYAVYKLAFKTGVHFGNGALSNSGISFLADNLFSALFIEALKLEKSSELYEQVKNGRLIFSDAFPYIKDTFYLPKPMIYIEPKDKGSSKAKKAYKKLKYIPAQYMKDYLSGEIDTGKCDLGGLGDSVEHIMAAVSREGADTVPYSVGTFFFNTGCGLYIIAGYENESAIELFEELMESLSFTGIGGKKTSGKGKFDFITAKKSDLVMNLLGQKTGRYMLLSTALPKDEELEAAIEGAAFLMQRRAGFIYSDSFAEESLKKNNLYTMQAGSCFKNTFNGDIYDVSGGRGKHAVYRYAKPMFMEV